MPFTEALVDLHKLAHREYRLARVLNYAVYCSLVAAVALFFYSAFSGSSPVWVVASTTAVMLSVIAGAFRFVWYGTYDRFLKSMAMQRPDSLYATVFQARANR
ncbi:hypothetical protein [Shinella sp. M31]|uniref:hypothetical protein n=1 Tax=Shinella sp. M31 TaxID=3368615 RepID=UPI003B9E2EE4